MRAEEETRVVDHLWHHKCMDGIVSKTAVQMQEMTDSTHEPLGPRYALVVSRLMNMRS